MPIEKLVNSILQALAGSEPESTTGSSNGTQSIGGTEVDTTNNAVVPIAKPKKKLVIIEQIHELSSFSTDRSSSNFESHFPADTICLHYSAARKYPGLSGGINTLYDGNVASSHFFLSRSGRIIQIVDLNKVAYTQYANKERALNSASNVVREREIDPNQYCYSIECASIDTDMGSLSYKQMESLPYNMIYIKNNSGGRVEFSRIWEGFPYLPNKNVIGEILTYPDGAEVALDQRLFHNVYGNIICHNDISRSEFCPGAHFPWINLLSKLGVYPVSLSPEDGWANGELIERKKNIAESTQGYYDDLEEKQEEISTYVTNKKSYLEKYSNKSDMLTQSKIDENLGKDPTPTVPFYKNPNYIEPTIEYVVWKRTKSNIIETDDVADILDDLKIFLEGKEVDAEKKLIKTPYEKDSYEVLIYE